MSHNNNHNFLILILFLLFPEVFIVLGIGYLIYIFFVPLLIIGVIILIVYALSNKKNNQKVEDNKSNDVSKRALLSENTNSDYDTDLNQDNFNGPDDEEKHRIMDEYDLDEDDAERVQEIAEEWGIDEDEAAELIDDL